MDSAREVMCSEVLAMVWITGWTSFIALLRALVLVAMVWTVGDNFSAVSNIEIVFCDNASDTSLRALVISPSCLVC